jgi:serine protease Do
MLSISWRSGSQCGSFRDIKVTRLRQLSSQLTTPGRYGRGTGLFLRVRWTGFAGAAVALACLVSAGCAGRVPIGVGDRQEIIDRIISASVKVTLDKDGRRLGSGSGVVVASRIEGPHAEMVSYVLTAQHVFDGKDGATILVHLVGANAARVKTLPATLYRKGDAETLDLALLRVPGIALIQVQFPDDNEVRLGEEILVVGFPWGKRLGVFGGIVSQVPADTTSGGPTEEGSEQTIVVDASSAKGVSGGGVFREATGCLVGIVEGYQTASIAVEGRTQSYSLKVPMPGETFAVPIARVRRFVEDAGLGNGSSQVRDTGDQKEE